MNIDSEILKSTRILNDLREMFYALRELEPNWEQEAFRYIIDRAREEIALLEILHYDTGSNHSFKANEICKN